MLRSSSRAVIAVFTALLILAGCSIPQGDDQHPGDRPSRKPSPDTAAPAAILKAQRQARGYDYPAALQTLSAVHSTRARQLIRSIKKQQRSAHAWKRMDQIPHLFFHSLIVDPQRAFHAGSRAQGYRDYMVTVDEFRAMLPQLRRRGYVLVLPRQIARPDARGAMRYQKIILPAGKKPLVISQDDVNYYEYMRGDGFATNLTVDADGKITNTYVRPDKRTVQGSYDLLPVLDDFVAAHPDFGYRGAKGVLGLTGYNGILGYRTSHREYGNRKDFAEQRRTAKRVATAIKADGWQLASHSWGHLNFTSTGLGVLKADTRRWDREVRPLTGPTDLLIYPFGADISGVQPYGRDNAKYRYLHADGFNFFFNVDASSPAWMQKHAGSLRQARINVDGIRLASTLDGDNAVLKHFFDVRSVIDPARHHKIDKQHRTTRRP
ncbi:polysaccharide deacetylase family protein [Microlunatus soli]|uniref:Polysaccharide deacetylase n=1 Tax=Microlunatus soli TaxID=630515 RepID=A0A1H1ZX24_9ACTN|nr:hypothetical protein [Microlunatus soli]SDT37796.1 hypothetical protein SAMN04489812_5489 [Microlunatus soli]